jgi:hypothetical protein
LIFFLSFISFSKQHLQDIPSLTAGDHCQTSFAGLGSSWSLYLASCSECLRGKASMKALFHFLPHSSHSHRKNGTVELLEVGRPELEDTRACLGLAAAFQHNPRRPHADIEPREKKKTEHKKVSTATATTKTK